MATRPFRSRPPLATQSKGGQGAKQYGNVMIQIKTKTVEMLGKLAVVAPGFASAVLKRPFTPARCSSLRSFFPQEAKGMTRALPRTNFNSSRLIRLLSELAVVDVAKSPQDFAERLGEWLDVGDAITLSAALNCSVAGLAPARPGEPAGVATALSAALLAELARLRSALTESITTDGVFKTGKVRIKLPTPAAGATPESAADFAPWHRYYQAHQRDMESNIGLLRNTVRATLSNHSPALRQIAELDAAFVKVLADRERSLLAMVPSLLEKRFGQLRRAHLAATVDASVADDPTQWLLPGGWLAGFCRELQQVLLAELDLRLQAVIGLIEAFSNEVTRPQ